MTKPAVHLRADKVRTFWTACKRMSNLVAHDPWHVTCLSCQKTEKFRQVTDYTGRPGHREPKDTILRQANRIRELEDLLLRIYRETHGLDRLTLDTEKRVRNAIMPRILHAAREMGELG